MNNLRIDLITPEERRSASPVSPKFIKRVAIAILVLAVVGSASILAIKVRTLDRQLVESRNEWDKMKPQVDKVREEQKRLVSYRKILTELDTVKATRLEMVQFMHEFREAVPKGIQVESMSLRQSYADGPKIATYISLRSNTRGRRGGRDLKQFQRGMSNSVPSAGEAAYSKVEDFKVDRRGKEPTLDRMFRLDAQYKPRKADAK